jgi:hypothetical protein
MKTPTILYIIAVVFILLAACGLGIGGFVYLGSLDPVAGQPEWAGLASTLACFGGLMLLAGIGVLVIAVRRQKQDAAQTQNVTLQVDLPGETRIEQMKCQSCGGALSPQNVRLVAGAPVVSCPYCGTSYQLTEEPKW